MKQIHQSEKLIPSVNSQIEQKLFKLNHDDRMRLSPSPQTWRRAHYPHLREDYPPPHHLAHARNARNSYREFCGGRPFAYMSVRRNHATHNCTSLCRRGHAFGSRSTTEQKEYMRKHSRLVEIWCYHRVVAHSKRTQLKRNVTKISFRENMQILKSVFLFFSVMTLKGFSSTLQLIR